MDTWITWIIQSATMLAIGVIGFFLKQTITSLRAEIDKNSKRMDVLEAKLNDTIQNLPHIYTLRDDFLRIVSRFEGKIDSLRDLIIADQKGRRE